MFTTPKVTPNVLRQTQELFCTSLRHSFFSSISTSTIVKEPFPMKYTEGCRPEQKPDNNKHTIFYNFPAKRVRFLDAPSGLTYGERYIYAVDSDLKTTQDTSTPDFYEKERVVFSR